MSPFADPTEKKAARLATANLSGAYANAVKADFASQFVTSATESCASVKGLASPFQIPAH
jgi:hypothetical protein